MNLFTRTEEATFSRSLCRKGSPQHMRGRFLYHMLFFDTTPKKSASPPWIKPAIGRLTGRCVNRYTAESHVERKIVKLKVKKWNKLICGLNHPQFCPCNEFNMSAAVLQSNCGRMNSDNLQHNYI